jgi:hypothetical protein
MTREEASERLKEMSVQFALCVTDEQLLEDIKALDIAIEALEQEPTAEYSSDVISRQGAIDAVNKNRDSVFHDSVHYEDAVYDISNLPSAQVEKAYELGKADRPTGHWIEDEKQNVLMRKFIEKGEVWRVCSVCGAGHMIGHKYATDKAYHDMHHNFCPNCGSYNGGENEI